MPKGNVKLGVVKQNLVAHIIWAQPLFPKLFKLILAMFHFANFAFDNFLRNNMQNEKPLASEKTCQNDGFHKTRSFFSCFCGKGGSFFCIAICSILF